jgi:hypothetical protein
MRALDIVEAVVGDDPEITSYVVDVARWAAQAQPNDEQAAIGLANRELADFRVKFVMKDPVVQGGGRVEADGTIRLPVDQGFYQIVQSAQFPDIVRHEYVHQEQVRHAGPEAEKMAADSYRQALNPDGSVNMKQYYLIPYEVMAYAKSAADDLKKEGLTKDAALQLVRKKVKIDELPLLVQRWVYPYYTRRKKHPQVWHKFLRYIVDYVRNWDGSTGLEEREIRYNADAATRWDFLKDYEGKAKDLFDKYGEAGLGISRTRKRKVKPVVLPSSDKAEV